MQTACRMSIVLGKGFANENFAKDLHLRNFASDFITTSINATKNSSEKRPRITPFLVLDNFQITYY